MVKNTETEESIAVGIDAGQFVRERETVRMTWVALVEA
jgi:hypothetical protein